MGNATPASRLQPSGPRLSADEVAALVRAARAKALFAEWNALLDRHQAPTNATVPTYAQVVHIVNQWAGEKDTLIAAAGAILSMIPLGASAGSV